MTETPMLPSHAKEVADGRKRSLINAGIGLAYVDRSLSSVDVGEQAGEWLASRGSEVFRKGRAAFVETQTAQGIDTVVLMARALHLNGIGVRVVDLYADTRLAMHAPEILKPVARFRHSTAWPLSGHCPTVSQ